LEGDFGPGDNQLSWDTTTYPDWTLWGGPFTFAVTADGHFWFPDKVNGLMKRLDKQGHVDRTFAVPKDQWITNIAIRSDGALWVSYLYTDSVYGLDPGYVSGTGGETQQDSGWWEPITKGDSLRLYDSAGTLMAAFSLPVPKDHYPSWSDASRLFAIGTDFLVTVEDDHRVWAYRFDPSGAVRDTFIGIGLFQNDDGTLTRWSNSAELWAASGGRYRVSKSPRSPADTMQITDAQDSTVVNIAVADICVGDYLGMDERSVLYATGWRTVGERHEGILLALSPTHEATIVPLEEDTTMYSIKTVLGADGNVYWFGGPDTGDRWVVRQYTFRK